MWRYSRIGSLDLDAFTPAGPPVDAGAGRPAELEPLLDAIGPRSGLVLVRDGRVLAVELDDGVAAKGVRVGLLAEAPDGDELLGSVAGPVDPFVELNTAFVGDGVVVSVPDGVAVPHPVVVAHWVTVPGAAVFPRLVVRAGEASQVTVLDHIGSPAALPTFVAPVVELDVAAAANVGYLALQELSHDAWHIGYHASQVGADATLTSSIVALGGSYARVRTDSELAGRGGTSHLLAAYFGDGDQMHDFRTMQDHAAPRTTSKLLFKGAVEDESHAVYTGLIRVRKGAGGTDAEQTNRNLVLTPGARADSVPNLEIEENDVRCTHASAVGPVDEDQRYYLEARGVPPEVAERLIVLGFFDDVIAHRHAPVPSLRPRLRAAVAAKLAKR
ncbi:MAG TPA: Fe-S cluster assembly protein SufD [Acidimicrobiales bacterium]|nr:Fe-S cluster assembly protein SufD [Acidimicrobiales bacterium]